MKEIKIKCLKVFIQVYLLSNQLLQFDLCYESLD